MNRRCRRGFASLELLIAAAVFLLIIAILYSGYRLGMESWEAGEHTRAAVSELSQAGSFIRRYTAQAIPLAISDSSAWQLWFEGQAGRLVFVTPLSPYRDPGGAYELTLQVVKRRDGERLTVSRRLLHPDAVPGKAGIDESPRNLVTGLESATFDYFGPTGERGELAWQTSWEGRQQLPRLVRLRLVSKQLGAWPDIVIRLPSDDNRYQRATVGAGAGQPVWLRGL